MLKIKDIHSVAGNDYNEDVVAFNEHLAFVIDGDEELETIDNKTNYGSNTEWFVNRLKEEFLLSSVENRPNFLFFLNTVLNKIGLEYQKMYSTKKLLTNLAASIGIVEEKNEIINLYFTGNVGIIIEYMDGSIGKFSDNHLRLLNRQIINKMYRLSLKNNIDVKETLSLVNRFRIQNRQKLNASGGYNNFDISGKGLKHLNFKSIKKNDVKSILIVSGGFYQAIDILHLYKNEQELLENVKKEGIIKIIKKILERQKRDRLLNKYPRFNVHDDTSAIYLEIAKIKEK